MLVLFNFNLCGSPEQLQPVSLASKCERSIIYYYYYYYYY